VLAIVVALVLASKWEGLGMVRETGAWLGLVGVAGGLAAGAATFALAWRGGSDPRLIVLMGVLVSGTLGALAALVMLQADENQVRLVLHWTIGSSNGRVWVHWGMLWPFALTGLAAGFASAGLANALQLGDGVATGLGLAVERARFLLLFVAAWLTAGAVCVVGGIGFVGLIGPHIARRLSGSDARRLFPAAAITSALLLCAADLVARTLPLAWLGKLTGLPIAGAAGLPVGVVMPMLGVPFFLWLLLRGRERT
jgi:iron complex transport system permease protein